jgi:hypothetical protein
MSFEYGNLIPKTRGQSDEHLNDVESIESFNPSAYATAFNSHSIALDDIKYTKNNEFHLIVWRKEKVCKWQ